MDLNEISGMEVERFFFLPVAAAGGRLFAVALSCGGLDVGAAVSDLSAVDLVRRQEGEPALGVRPVSSLTWPRVALRSSGVAVTGPATRAESAGEITARLSPHFVESSGSRPFPIVSSEPASS